MSSLPQLGLALVLLVPPFVLLERCFPAVRGRALLRAGWRTDLAYWFLTPLVARTLTFAVFAALAIAVALAAGAPLDEESIAALLARPSAVSAWPLAIQIPLALFLGDGVAYAMHRVLHAGWLWRLHAVHHSSRELDWLSSVRLHPLNDVLTRVPQAALLLAAGFHPLIAATYVPVLTLYALLLHANVPWSFGPLRAVIASPRFHRWHHARDAEARGKNFAGLFPVWDLAFGTYWMPRGVEPREFGLAHGEVSENVWRQWTDPFRRARS